MFVSQSLTNLFLMLEQGQSVELEEYSDDTEIGKNFIQFSSFWVGV